MHQNIFLNKGNDAEKRKKSDRQRNSFVADIYFWRAKKEQKHHIFITHYTPERRTSKTSPPAEKRSLIQRPRHDLTQPGTHGGGAPFSNIRVYLKFKIFFLYYFFLNKYTNGRKLFWFTELYFIALFGCPGLMFPPR